MKATITNAKLAHVTKIKHTTQTTEQKLFVLSRARALLCSHGSDALHPRSHGQYNRAFLHVDAATQSSRPLSRPDGRHGPIPRSDGHVYCHISARGISQSAGACGERGLLTSRSPTERARAAVRAAGTSAGTRVVTVVVRRVAVEGKRAHFTFEGSQLTSRGHC